MAASSINDASKATPRKIIDLLFADDAALVAHTEQAMRRITSCLADTSRLFGLDFSLKKTEGLHQPVPLDEQRQPQVTIGDFELTSAQQFTYLYASSHLMHVSTNKLTPDFDGN